MLRNAACVDTAHIAQSGMAAPGLRLQAHAHNLDNPGTESFRRSTVAQTARAEGGITAAWDRAAAAGPAMVEDLVGQLSARNEFPASLAVFRSGDAMTRALLDAVA